jgi:hypothetical protein
MDISLDELRYWYWRELATTPDEMAAGAMRRLMELADQRRDPNVALRASKAILEVCSKPWRDAAAAIAASEQEARVAKLTLAQVEAELARLRAKKDD